MSKNQPSSSISGSSSSARSRRSALKPHWKSLTLLRNDVRTKRLYAREISSRLGPRTTRAPRARRVPTAMSPCPDSTEATSGKSPSSEVERSTSM